MTGLPELNYPAFEKAADHLRGIETVDHVYNPSEWETLNRCEFDLLRAFEEYCRYIIWEADAVVVLPGWENSPGANAEVALARAVRKKVYAYSKQTGYESLHDDHSHDRHQLTLDI